jgi:hypothetical protein
MLTLSTFGMAAALCLSCTDANPVTTPVDRASLDAAVASTAPLDGCARIRVSIGARADVTVDSMAGAACGPIQPVLVGAPVFDRARGTVKLPVALLNTGQRKVRAPARLYGWEDSLVVEQPAGLARNSHSAGYLAFAGADSAIGTGAADYAGAMIWRFDQALAPAEAAQSLAAGDTSQVRWVEIRVHSGVERFCLVLHATARRASNPVPVEPPDSTPSWVYSPENMTSTSPYMTGEFPKNVLWVGFSPSATQAEKQRAIDAVDGEVVGGMRRSGFYIVRITDDGTTRQLFDAVRTLNSIPQVRFAGPGGYVSPMYLRPQDASGWLRTDWRLDPNAAHGSKWGFERIAAPYAWGCSTGDSTLHIGVVDLGFRNIADLVRNGASGAVLSKWPGQNHGTKVASILAAHGNDTTGIAGMMWRAQLDLHDPYSLNAAGQPRLRLDSLHDALMAAGTTADIVNLSSGYSWHEQVSPTYTPHGASDSATANLIHLIVRDAVERLEHEQHRTPLLVMSASNDGLDSYWSGTANVAGDFPDRVIVVGSSNIHDERSNFSNRNQHTNLVSVMAPGENVAALDGLSNIIQDSGTSFSAPLVTGLAGLLKSFDPRLTTAEIRGLIVEGARRGGRAADGVPIINAYESLKAAARRRGAPLCGNRVWAQDGRLLVQRDTAAGAQPDTIYAGGATQGVSALHGGHQVVFGDKDGRYHMLAWKGTGWAEDATVTNFSDLAGPATLSFQGFSHDRDSFVSASAGSGGVTLYVTHRVAPFVNSSGAPVYNWQTQQGPTVPTPPSSASATSVQILKAVQTGGNSTMENPLDSILVGRWSDPGPPRVAFYPAGDTALVAVNTIVRTATAGDWFRCPGWEQDRANYFPVYSYATGEWSSTVTYTHFECRNVHRTYEELPATVYSVPLSGGAASVVYRAAGAVDQLAVADGTRKEFYARGYDRAESTDEYWAEGYVPRFRAPAYWSDLAAHVAVRRTTNPSTCANQYRSFGAPGTVLFASTGSAYNACAALPFSFAPNRIADGPGTLFPRVAPVAPVLAPNRVLPGFGSLLARSRTAAAGR